MKLAYFTPLNPLKSGVCDVVESVLPTLAKFRDIQIDLFIAPGYEPSNPEITQQFTIRPMSDYDNEEVRNSYHLSVFHMGNNISFHDEISDYFFKYGGILEIHDVSLHHFLSGKTLMRGDVQGYIDMVVYCHGEEMRIPAKEVAAGLRPPLKDSKEYYPVNKKYIDSAQAIIVHSDFAKQIVKGLRPNVRTVVIPLPPKSAPSMNQEQKQKARLELGIADDVFVMGSFGYITKAKRIFAIMDALAQIKKAQSNSRPFQYFIVGFDGGLDLQSYIASKDLADCVTVVGEVSPEDFEKYIDICDLCFNLRYPTQGESSASFPRLAAKAKVVAVTNIGSFEEYDRNIIYKIRYDENEISDICQMVTELMDDPQKQAEREKRVLEFAKKELDVPIISKKYYQFYWELHYGNTKEHDYLDLLVDHLFSLGLTNSNYIQHLAQLYDGLLE